VSKNIILVRLLKVQPSQQGPQTSQTTDG